MGGHKHRRKLDDLLIAQNYTCALMITDECKQNYGILTMLDKSDVHVDHIHPVVKIDTYQGKDINEMANLQATCAACNLTKNDRLIYK